MKKYVKALSAKAKVLRDVGKTNKRPPGILDLLDYSSTRLREIQEEFCFKINGIVVAEDDPIADLSKSITNLVNTNVNARLKRNEFRAGVLQQLENSTWEDSLSNLALSCTTPAQKSVNEASTKSYTDTLNGPADPSQWPIDLEDTTKRVTSEKATAHEKQAHEDLPLGHKDEVLERKEDSTDEENDA